jgi:hypothetical protein
LSSKKTIAIPGVETSFRNSPIGGRNEPLIAF